MRAAGEESLVQASQRRAGRGYRRAGGDNPDELRLFYATFRTAAQAQNQLGLRNPQLEENNASRLQLFEV